MRIEEGISVGISAIFANKLRSLLTMLGIIIGVASVLAMIAIGDGAKTIVLQEAERFGGASMFSILYSPWVRKGDRWVRNRSNQYFEYDDVLAIEAECPSVELVVPQLPRWRGVLVQAAHGAEKRSGYNGVDFDFPIGMHWKVRWGRFFSETEFYNREKVCVVGTVLAEELFGTQDPVGQEIKVARSHSGSGRNMERLRIVGVMTERGTSLRFGFSWDDIVMMPLTTVQERFTGDDKIPEFKVKAKSVKLVDTAVEEVKAVMRKRHRNQDDFFRVWILSQSIKELGRISQIIKITLGSIAGFSLLVGGIGIMNMMLVSVTERTREIGLRKAIGAKRGDILFQFLVEAIAICGVGGTIGIGLGIAAGYGMGHVATKIVRIIDQWPVVISIEWTIISASFSAGIGLFFGLYPAIKAAQLSPIEALRTE